MLTVSKITESLLVKNNQKLLNIERKLVYIEFTPREIRQINYPLIFFSRGIKF